MYMFNNYKKYNTSFIEVILERLNQIYDLDLNADNFNYIKSNSYKLEYLKYIAPGNFEIEKLITIIKSFEESQFLIIYLPYKIQSLKPILSDNAWDEFIQNFNFSIREEFKLSKKEMEKQMGEPDPFNNYPLLFKDKFFLVNFLLSEEEEIEHFFMNNILLFPINMVWFMHFDYDLGAIHFAYKNEVFENIQNQKGLNSLIYSRDQVNQLIIEAKE